MVQAKWLRILIPALVVGGMAACQDLPTGPTEPVGDPFASTAMRPGSRLPIPGGLRVDPSRTSANEDDLKDLLRQEKARLKAEKSARKAEFELRRDEWKVLKKAAKKVKGLENLLSFTTCEPLEYEGAVDIIGPEGGKLRVGPHELTVPKGALSEYVLITAEMPVSNMVEVEFEPHGLRFDLPADLSLSYKHCVVPARQKHWIAYIDGADVILEWLISLDRKGLDEVSSEIDHFSRYAVVAN